jgi:tetraacyldisaccharide 4'-kinase
LISFAWSTLNFIRRKFYSSGLLKAEVMATPSVLIGNLQAGGAGKTPLVIRVAEEAIRRGLKAGVVSRGYGRKSQEMFVVSPGENEELRFDVLKLGDEPVEVLKEVPEVFMGVGKDRVQVAKALEAKGVNFLIFDDGFQNLKFKTQKTLLAVTDAKPNEVVYRDFLNAAQSATLVVQTKGFPKPSVVPAKPVRWEVGTLPKEPVWLLCAVADPNEVAQFYKNLGVSIERIISFPDHAAFDPIEIHNLADHARSHGVSIWVTPKDEVKLRNDKSLAISTFTRKIASDPWLEDLFER